MNEHFLDGHLDVGLRESQILTVFWIGFLMYSLSYVLLIAGNVNPIMCNVFQITGLLLFFVAGSQLLTNNIHNIYLKILFYCYLLWSLIIVTRGYILQYEYIKLSLIDGWFGVLIYFVPFFLLLPRNFLYFKRLFQVALILGVFFIFYDLMYIEVLMRQGHNVYSQNIVEYFSKTLSVPMLFLVLTFKYHSKRTRVIAILVVTFMLLLAVIRARRGLLVMTALPVLFGYLLYLSQKQRKAGILVQSIFAAVLVAGVGAIFYETNQDSLFGYISQRGLEDTRSRVELCFFNDMTVQDWWIGKGINGTYFCPGIDPNDLTGYRGVIETDYLQMILKGGLIYLTIFLAIAVPALIKGIFYSQNLLSKAAGVWILWFLINMYPSSMHTFTLQAVFLWISIGICYSKTMRSIPEQLLVDYFRGFKNRSEISEAFEAENYKLN